MLIGLTYDMRADYAGRGLSEEALAEFDSPETIDAIEGALRTLGHQTDRIGHVRALAARLVAGDRWDMVFNIAEGLSGRAREAQAPALLEAFDVPYVFSDPVTQGVGLDKALAKRIVRDAGVPTAPFAVLRDEEDASTASLDFPVFLKPLAEGTGKGCERASKAANRAEMAAVAHSLRTRFSQPVIAETFLPGREFTVGIVGTGHAARIVGVMEIILLETAEAEIYSFENKEMCESRVLYQLAGDAEARDAGRVALDAYRALECRDGGRVDLRSDAHHRPQFLEVNTLPGLHPTHSDLPMLATKAGWSYADMIGAIVASAAGRAGFTTDAKVA